MKELIYIIQKGKETLKNYNLFLNLMYSHHLMKNKILHICLKVMNNNLKYKLQLKV